VVEVVSPGSRKADKLDKMAEYADAGIPFYWLVWLSGDHVLSIDVHVLDHTLWVLPAVPHAHPGAGDEHRRRAGPDPGRLEPAGPAGAGVAAAARAAGGGPATGASQGERRVTCC
jgi:hypothetical protein